MRQQTVPSERETAAATRGTLPGGRATSARPAKLLGPLVVLLVGLSMTAWGWKFVRASLFAAESQRFTDLSNDLKTALEGRLRTIEAGLRGVRAMHVASADTGAEEWSRSVQAQDLENKFPGALGFGYVQLVQREELDSFLSAAQAEQPGFALTTDGAHRNLFVTRYIEPSARNAQARGFDLGSDPASRYAAERAALTGGLAVTTPMTLPQSQRPGRGLLFLLPVYQGDLDPPSELERRARIDGWVCAPLDIDEMMLRGGYLADQVDFELFDGPEPLPRNRIFDGCRDGSLAGVFPDRVEPGTDAFQVETDISCGDRVWTLRLRTRQSFRAQSARALPWIVVGTGAAGSLMVSVIVWLLTSGRAHAMRLAEGMTSDLRRTESELRHRQAELEVVHDASPLGMFVTDAEGSCIYVNQTFQRVTRLRPETARAVGWIAAIHPDDMEAAAREWGVAATAGVRYEGVHRFRRPDGSTVWASVKAAPISQDDKLRGYVGVVEDVTARHHADLQLQEALAALQNAIDEGIARVQPDGRYSAANASYAAMLGCSPADITGMMWEAVIVPEDRADMERALRCMRETGKAETEVRAQRPDGGQFHQSVVLVRITDEAGEYSGCYCFVKDVTERKLAERRLADALEMLAKQNQEYRALSERAHRVVDDVSHEFRTPLAVIKEFASIIADGVAGPVTPEQSAYLGIVDNAVIDLNHMVEDLLDSSKLRAGRLRVDRRGHEVTALFEQVRPLLAKKAAARHITIQEVVEPGAGMVYADEEKARRVITNLMTNAIKFSPEGSTIKIWAAHSDANDGEVRIGITDQGPGLSGDEVAALFGRFQQLSSARSCSAKGFGLGLNIAQELAWLNLGRLGVKSRAGAGATFYFTLARDEPRSIVTHFFEAVDANEHPADHIALLRVRPSGPSENLDEERGFLAATTRPTDLVLVAPDRQSLLVLGLTSSLEAWTSRLNDERAKAISESPAGLSRLDIEVAGAWEFPSGQFEARQRLEEFLLGEGAHGQACTAHR